MYKDTVHWSRLRFRLHKRAARIIIDYIVYRDVGIDLKRFDLSEQYIDTTQYCKSQHVNIGFRYQIENVLKERTPSYINSAEEEKSA